MPEKENSIKEKISKWLRSQGYPLEMKVSSSLRKQNFEVRQSWYYNDPETGKPREIDILALQSEVYGILRVEFLIECKHSTKPWILFSSEQTLENYNRSFAFGILSKAARKTLIKHISNNFDKVSEVPWVIKKGRVAYGITQAFASGNDVTYQATLSSLKAAISRKVEGEKSYSGFTFSFPVVIVEGQLFECYISCDDKIEIAEVDQAFYHFPVQIKDVLGTTIRIVSVKGIDKFCSEAKQIFEKLNDLFKDDIQEELAEVSYFLVKNYSKAFILLHFKRFNLYILNSYCFK